MANLIKKREIFEYFSQFLTEQRKDKIEKNANQRTRYITVVLEDLFQSHNISASLRSCDCFGVQDVHIIEHKHTFSIQHGVAKGSAQWLDLYRYNKKDSNNTQICFDNLKAQGYKIAATSPHKNDRLLHELPLNEKIALVFGTEQEGLSWYALNNADYYVKIPMYGFTESFNVSVSVALSLYDITQRLRLSSFPWKLSADEIVDLQLTWLGMSTMRTKEIQKLLS